jgi:hypothetical protein
MPSFERNILAFRHWTSGHWDRFSSGRDDATKETKARVKYRLRDSPFNTRVMLGKKIRGAADVSGCG